MSRLSAIIGGGLVGFSGGGGFGLILNYVDTRQAMLQSYLANGEPYQKAYELAAEATNDVALGNLGGGIFCIVAACACGANAIYDATRREGEE